MKSVIWMYVKVKYRNKWANTADLPIINENNDTPDAKDFPSQVIASYGYYKNNAGGADGDWSKGKKKEDKSSKKQQIFKVPEPKWIRGQGEKNYAQLLSTADKEFLNHGIRRANKLGAGLEKDFFTTDLYKSLKKDDLLGKLKKANYEAIIEAYQNNNPDTDGDELIKIVRQLFTKQIIKFQ